MEKSFKNGLVFKSIVFLFFVSLPYLDAEYSEEEKVDCNLIMMRFAKIASKSLTICGKELKANATSAKDLQDKTACLIKCIIRRLNLSDEYGVVTDVMLEKTMQPYIPNTKMLAEVHDQIFVPCSSIASQVDPADEYCKSYAPYVGCIQNSLDDFLKTSAVCKRKSKGSSPHHSI